jgi:Reverse transcriptase (RNA-dependent DNA polymerase)
VSAAAPSLAGGGTLLVERAVPAPPLERVAALHGRRVREVTVLHPTLAARYTELVSSVALRVDGALSPSVAANRVAVASLDPPRLVLRSFRGERIAFGRLLAGLARRTPCLLFADVRECYRSIAPGVVGSSLRALGCGGSSVDAIVAFLRGLRELGVEGLPVGPDPSAVLANAVLSEVDRALERLGPPHVRWVDDLVVGVDGSIGAARALEVTREALDRVGLRLNDAKTRVVLDPAPDALARGISVARSAEAVG